MVELSCQGDFGVATTFQRAYSGDALNTAVAARRLGSSACFLTRLAKDPFGLGLMETLRREGLETKPLRTGPGQTGLYFVRVNEDGHREFLYYRKDSAASTLGPDDVTEALIRQARLVYASGITLAISSTCRQAVHKAFQLARQHNIPTAFDPNYRPRLWPRRTEAFDALNELLPMVDIVLPSLPEDTQGLIGFDRPDQVMDYFWHKGVPLVVAKVGARGCFVGYKGQVEHLPALPGVAKDTTGAGDAFNGGFLHGFVERHSLLDCARLGIITAGLKVQEPGVLSALPTREQVYHQFQGSPAE